MYFCCCFFCNRNKWYPVFLVTAFIQKHLRNMCYAPNMVFGHRGTEVNDAPPFSLEDPRALWTLHCFMFKQGSSGNAGKGNPELSRQGLCMLRNQDVLHNFTFSLVCLHHWAFWRFTLPPSSLLLLFFCFFFCFLNKSVEIKMLF